MGPGLLVHTLLRRPYHRRAKAEDAERFCERLGGERLATPPAAISLTEDPLAPLVGEGSAAAVTNSPIERGRLYTHQHELIAPIETWPLDAG